MCVLAVALVKLAEVFFCASDTTISLRLFHLPLSLVLPTISAQSQPHHLIRLLVPFRELQSLSQLPGLPLL